MEEKSFPAPGEHLEYMFAANLRAILLGHLKKLCCRMSRILYNHLFLAVK